MQRKNILVVDDEPKIIRFLSRSLTLSGFTVFTAYTGREALELYHSESPDLIILDLGLPDMDGLSVLHDIRLYSTVPLIILTARDDEESKVKGLELGADDYLTKPFGTRELEARIQALLRRIDWSPQPSDITEFQFRELEVDFRAHRVHIGETEVHLTPTEYDLLRVMIQHAGQVLMHGDLLSQVWGDEYRNDLAILRVNISRLRQKLEGNPREPQYIVTVPGVGYTIPTE